LLTVCAIGDAVQSLAFAKLGGAFAVVRELLPVIRVPLSLISDSFAVIGEALSFFGDTLAPRDLRLMPRKRLLGLTRLAIASVTVTLHVSTSVSTAGTGADRLGSVVRFGTP
jgi:hypothetical protein